MKSVNIIPPISKPQIQKINVLLNKLNMKDYKETLVMSYSSSRTTHISELNIQEAKSFIQFLVRQDPDERKRSLILSLGYKCEMLYGDTPEDKKINIAKINKFLLERGAVKKELNKLNSAELTKVHRQFEAIVKSHQLNNSNKVLQSICKDLGISMHK